MGLSHGLFLFPVDTKKFVGGLKHTFAVLVADEHWAFLSFLNSEALLQKWKCKGKTNVETKARAAQDFIYLIDSLKSLYYKLLDVCVVLRNHLYCSKDDVKIARTMQAMCYSTQKVVIHDITYFRTTCKFYVAYRRATAKPNSLKLIRGDSDRCAI